MPRGTAIRSSIRRSTLVKRIHERKRDLGLSRDDVDVAVGFILDTLAQGLAQGREVPVRGFGRLYVSMKEPGALRNPRTSEPVTRPYPHVRFMTYPPLAESFNDIARLEVIKLHQPTIDWHSIAHPIARDFPRSVFQEPSSSTSEDTRHRFWGEV
jgi:nucleoid DNA-binding protein